MRLLAQRGRLLAQRGRLLLRRGRALPELALGGERAGAPLLRLPTRRGRGLRGRRRRRGREAHALEKVCRLLLDGLGGSLGGSLHARAQLAQLLLRGSERLVLGRQLLAQLLHLGRAAAKLLQRGGRLGRHALQLTRRSGGAGDPRRADELLARVGERARRRASRGDHLALHLLKLLAEEVHGGIAGLRDGGLAGFATPGKNIERSMDGTSAALDISALYWVAFHQVLDCRTEQVIR